MRTFRRERFFIFIFEIFSLLDILFNFSFELFDRGYSAISGRDCILGGKVFFSNWIGKFMEGYTVTDKVIIKCDFATEVISVGI